MHALATALGWPFEVRRLVFSSYELLLHAVPHPTLCGVDRRASDPLEPPWPDLVVTAGRRNELPARWVRAHADKPVKLVHVGRPWSRPSPRMCPAFIASEFLSTAKLAIRWPGTWI